MNGFNSNEKSNIVPKPEVKIVEKFVETTNIYPLLVAVFIIIILLAIIITLVNERRNK